MAINTKSMPWGTIIEMMPGKRHTFPKAKEYTGIYLGAVKNSSILIWVIMKDRKTVHTWHRNFWRQKTK